MNAGHGKIQSAEEDELHAVCTFTDSWTDEEGLQLARELRGEERGDEKAGVKAGRTSGL